MKRTRELLFDIMENEMGFVIFDKKQRQQFQMILDKTKITEAAVSVILAVSCAAVCIMHYSEVVDQTCRSVERCLFTVIPSLYAPMFTACLITGSGLHISNIVCINSSSVF